MEWINIRNERIGWAELLKKGALKKKLIIRLGGPFWKVIFTSLGKSNVLSYWASDLSC
jgi:hypothetical protein